MHVQVPRAADASVSRAACCVSRAACCVLHSACRKLCVTRRLSHAAQFCTVGLCCAWVCGYTSTGLVSRTRDISLVSMRDLYSSSANSCNAMSHATCKLPHAECNMWDATCNTQHCKMQPPTLSSTTHCNAQQSRPAAARCVRTRVRACARARVGARVRHCASQ